MKNKQYLLMILDGVGLNDNEKGNAFAMAKKPNLNRLFRTYPNARLQASGLAVGLPEGQMGNSEVGHTNIGAGRAIYQGLTRINKSIADGDFYENKTLVDVIDSAKDNNKSLHLMGQVSDGGVHSYQEHLYALLDLAKRRGLDRVYIHAFLDGRDTPPASAIGYIEQLESKTKEIGIGQIATVSGRYYSMDRDSRWERVQLTYDAMTIGRGAKYHSSEKAIQDSYAEEIYDEFVKPVVIVDDNELPLATINDGDSVIFFNFRPDRARQLAAALTQSDFTGFERQSILHDLNFVTMTEYDATFQNVAVAFQPQSIKNGFGEYISNLGYNQLRIAETEKYAHVTFYFNCGQEGSYKGEERILIPSSKVATYDIKPEMSAYEITDKVIAAIEAKTYDVIIMNFANGDMVGHTGKIDKTIEAVEVLDDCTGKIIDALEKVHGEAIVTADHGNCEYMIDSITGGVVTSHSTFDVPIIIVSSRVKSIKNGKLCDIAPTLLNIMNQPIPSEMTGQSIIELK
jgi:2,3-bisphosphoglycerate-independent phosphoglycerate mutase